MEEVVGEVMRLHRSLPARPTVDEVEAAADLVRNLEREEQVRLDSLSRRRRGPEVPDELFLVLQQMERALIRFQCKDQKWEALRVIDLEETHLLFGDLIQRASKCVSPSSSSSSYDKGPMETVDAVKSPMRLDVAGVVSSVLGPDEDITQSSEKISMDDSYLKKQKSALFSDGGHMDLNLARGLPIARRLPVAGEVGDNLNLIKLASLIEASSKKGIQDLDLRKKLMDQVDWLPDSIGKLSSLVTLDLSENRIAVLPTTIGALSSLTKLDLHSNRIKELPESFGSLVHVIYLDLGGNQLATLPPCIGELIRLEELFLSSNQLSSLPDGIGKLSKLKKLDLETNNLDELPYTIGNCVSLVELRADYNRLKALPEAVGKLESLEILSVRYNNIKGLPTTMASLCKLKEVDASFNELESIPESLCLITTLVKLNVGNNFADLRYLPQGIGSIEMLQELDISNNQIKVLPDSFRMLSNLRVFRAEQNPLEVPPRSVAEMGAKVAVQYMEDLVAKRDVKMQPPKSKFSWLWWCFFWRPYKKKHM